MKAEAGEDKSEGTYKESGGSTLTGDPMEQEIDDEEDEATALMPVRGPLPPQEGSWASCIRLLDPVEGATVECLELGERFLVKKILTYP